MEDPWGSPWTADAPPKLDLPAPPPHAHFNLEHPNANHHSNASPHRLTPNRLPWDDDDAWGGWSDAKEANSPGWGRSPGLKPVEEPVSGLATPSPALGAGLDTWNEFETRKVEERREEPAISLRERQAPSQAKETAPLNAEDLWRTVDTADTVDTEPASESSPGPSISDDDARSSTSEVPPRLALPPGTRPAAVRQASKVQDLVEMFDGFAKRSHSVSPSPIGAPKRVLSEIDMVQAVSDGLRRKTEDRSSGEDAKQGDEEREEEESDEEDDEEFADFETETKIDEVIIEGAKEEPARDAGIEVVIPSVEEPTAAIVPERSPIMEPKVTEGPEEEVLEDTTLEQGLASSTETETDSEEESSAESDVEPPIALEAEDEQKDIQEPEAESLPREVDTTEIDPAAESPEATTQGQAARPNVSYSTDLSKLDDLFPSVDTSFPTPEPVPDVIIDDTFASITERKAWYRMSRFGSIQMHNSGDENYTRTTWHGSTVRDQSIRIVRRWMEEDSIAGRVVLGRRTAASGKIFNWDSSAPQVEIKELLNRKSHARQEFSVPKETDSATSSPSVAIPAFGWSSTSSPTFAIPPPLAHVSPITQHVPAIKAPRAASPVLQKLSEPTARAGATASPISPLGQPPITASYEAREEEEESEETDDEDEKEDDDSEDDSEDDDDDWGEMVTSPTVEVSNAVPSLTEIANTPTVTNSDIITPITSVVPPTDLFGDFATPIPTETQPKQASHPDVWEFGDMSFFEGAPAATQLVAHIPTSTPTPPPAPKQTEFSMLSKPSSIMTPLSPISIPSPQTTSAPPAPPAPKQDIQIDTSHDDETVANILRDLPDLSYMLR